MNWSYLFKHWFGTLLLGPIIAQLLIIYSSFNNQLFDFFEFYILFLVFGFFFSIPTYILYSLLYWYLAKANLDEKETKIILIFFVIAGVIITFWAIGGFSETAIISYSISSILSGMIFKLNYKNDHN